METFVQISGGLGKYKSFFFSKKHKVAMYYRVFDKLLLKNKLRVRFRNISRFDQTNIQSTNIETNNIIFTKSFPLIEKKN